MKAIEIIFINLNTDGELIAESGRDPDPLNLFVNTIVGKCLFARVLPFNVYLKRRIFL